MKSSHGKPESVEDVVPRQGPAPLDTTVSINKSWPTRLLRPHADAGPYAVVTNAMIAFRHSPEWDGALAYDIFRQQTVMVKHWGTRTDPYVWQDADDVVAAEWLQKNGIMVSPSVAAQAVEAVAKENPFHPVRDYLASLVWDGTERCSSWLTTYLGVEETNYTIAIGSKWLVSAVARVMKPGSKADHMLVLEGGQGARKSTALRTLAGDEFFTDDVSALGTKDSVIQLRGHWIVELAELDALRSAKDVAKVKAFLARQVDNIRPPYGRRNVKLPRESVFCGTVNTSTYLIDETGGRRFWPVKVGKIDLRALERDRDQLWAEAKLRYLGGEDWWLDDAADIRLAEAEQAERYEPGQWDEIIAEYVASREEVKVAEVLEFAIKKPKPEWTQADMNSVARALKHLGWERFRITSGSRPWAYRKVAK